MKYSDFFNYNFHYNIPKIQTTERAEKKITIIIIIWNASDNNNDTTGENSSYVPALCSTKPRLFN